jgi:phage/plasmid-like protein (TIGR03299 family)
MSHEVETTAYRNEVPWHGLGERFTDNPSAATMARRAKIDWTVSLQPIMAVLSPDEAVPVEDVFSLVRTFPDGKVEAIAKATVGDRYSIIQNDVNLMVAGLLQERGELTFETAGSLRGGRVVWVLAKLGSMMVKRIGADDDEITKYALFVNTHGDSRARSCGLTPVRDVCQNTLNFAQIHGLQSEIKIRHTGNAEGRAAEADSTLLELDALYDGFASIAATLEARKMSVQKVRNWAKALMDEINPRGTDKGKKADVDTIVRYFGEGAGNRGESGWDAFNGLSEFLDHHKKALAIAKDSDGWGPEKAARHLDSTLLGANRTARAKALVSLLK